MKTSGPRRAGPRRDKRGRAPAPPRRTSPVPTTPPTRHSLAAPLVLAVVVAVAYANALDAGLPMDAGILVLGNPALRAASWESVRTILGSDYWWPRGTSGVYRPLTTLSFWADWNLLGHASHPVGYHATNVGLHLACALAVLALFRRLGLAAWPALLAAVLFAVHPAATEAVTNVAGRADLLAALAVLGGLLCHARAGTAEGRARAGWTAALVATATAGMFGKENAVVLVPLVLAWDLAVGTPSARRRLWVAPALLAGVVVAMLGASAWVRSRGGPLETLAIDNPILTAGFWSGRLTAMKVLGLQLLTLAAPLRLSADYSYDQIPLVAPGLVPVLGALALGAAAVAATVWAWRRDRGLGFLVVVLFSTLLPTANLLLLIGSVRADRFLYLPLVGFAGAVARLAWGPAPPSGRRQQLATAGVVAAAVLCLAGTVRRNIDWRDDLTLWTATVEASPRSTKAQIGFAEALFAQGRPDDLDRVIAHAEEAVRIRPDYVLALADLGSYYGAKGDAAAEESPTAARGWYRRSLAVSRRGRAVERAAAVPWRRAMRARGARGRALPEYGNRLLAEHLMIARARLGHWQGVLATGRHLRRLDPSDPRTYAAMSVAFAGLGRPEDAAVSLLQALALGDTDPETQQQLVDAYRQLEPDGSMFRTDGSKRVSVDLAHPVVRRHRCLAFTGLEQVFDDAARPDMVAQLRSRAATVCEGGR